MYKATPLFLITFRHRTERADGREAPPPQHFPGSSGGPQSTNHGEDGGTITGLAWKVGVAVLAKNPPFMKPWKDGNTQYDRRATSVVPSKSQSPITALLSSVCLPRLNRSGDGGARPDTQVTPLADAHRRLPSAASPPPPPSPAEMQPASGRMRSQPPLEPSECLPTNSPRHKTA